MTPEQEPGDELDRAWRDAGGQAGCAEERADLEDVERARHLEENDEADEHAHVADAGHDEGLLRGRDGRRLVIPEADQQERGEADELPEDEPLEQVRGIRERQHRPLEQRQAREEAALARVVLHVA